MRLSPSPLTDFSLLLVVTSAQFSQKVCAAVTSRRKENFQGSSMPCSYFGSSLQLTAPSHLPLILCPSLETWRLSWGLQPAPRPNHTEAAWNAVTLRKTRTLVQCRECKRTVQAPPRLARSPCLLQERSNPCAVFYKYVFTALANPMQGIQIYPLYMMACIWQIVSFQSKYWIDYLLALVQFFT